MSASCLKPLTLTSLRMRIFGSRPIRLICSPMTTAFSQPRTQSHLSRGPGRGAWGLLVRGTIRTWGSFKISGGIITFTALPSLLPSVVVQCPKTRRESNPYIVSCQICDPVAFLLYFSAYTSSRASFRSAYCGAMIFVLIIIR